MSDVVNAYNAQLAEYSLSFQLANKIVKAAEMRKLVASRFQEDYDPENEEESKAFLVFIDELSDDDFIQNVSVDDIMKLIPRASKESLAGQDGVLLKLYPELLTEDVKLLKGEARQDRIILNYGRKLIGMRVNEYVSGGPNFDKIFNSVYTRHRGTYAKSRVGGSTISFDALANTPSGEFNIFELNPNAGLVLDELTFVS